MTDSEIQTVNRKNAQDALCVTATSCKGLDIVKQNRSEFVRHLDMEHKTVSDTV